MGSNREIIYPISHFNHNMSVFGCVTGVCLMSLWCVSVNAFVKSAIIKKRRGQKSAIKKVINIYIIFNYLNKSLGEKNGWLTQKLIDVYFFDVYSSNVYSYEVYSLTFIPLTFILLAFIPLKFNPLTFIPLAFIS